MMQEARNINYHSIFIDRLVDNLGYAQTTRQNKNFLHRKAREYSSRDGYYPERVMAHLKTAERVVTSRIRDPKKKAQAIETTNETIDESILGAIMDAGAFAADELRRNVSKSESLGIRSMYMCYIGIQEFAPFYIEPDKDESRVRDRRYMGPAEAAWNGVVKRTLDEAVILIGNEATYGFDPYTTPGRVRTRKVAVLDSVVSEYDLGARPDTKKAYSRVDGIEREMYGQGHSELLAKVLSNPGDEDMGATLRDVRLTADYGVKAGLSQDELGEARLQIVTGRLEHATTDFDPYETPLRMEKARTDLERILGIFDSHGITSAQEDTTVTGIVQGRYGKAFDELLSATLERISNQTPKNVDRIVQDVQLVLQYGLNAGVGVNELHGVANQMLEANSRGRMAHYAEGYIREGIGEQLQKDTEHWGPEMAESVRERGRQIEAEGRALMSTHPTIESAINETIESISASMEGAYEDPGIKARVIRGLGRVIRGLGRGA